MWLVNTSTYIGTSIVYTISHEMRGEECPGKTYSMSSPCFLLFFSLLAPLFHGRTLFVSADTITPAQSIKDGQNLTSQSGTFELGFFSPSNSKNRYLGIWYKTIPLQTIVWVANGGSPINDSSGVLMISTTGNLVIQNGRNDIVWSTNSLKTAANPVADFLASGNLVLRDRNSAEYLWQSFDYPSDTLLPGMKLGWDLKTGLNRYIRSWKCCDDPSPGDFTYAFDINGSLDPLLRRGSKTYYRSGMWNGMRYSGSPDLKPNPIFTYNVFHNQNEVYYMYQLVKQSVISRLVITQEGSDGKLERSTWVANTQNWVPHVPIPRDRCDAYSLCGPDSTCDVTDVPVCQCLKGFKPRTSSDWNDMDWSQGCQRRTALECDKGTGFMKFTEVKLPDMMRSWMNTSMSIEECRVKCLQNCTCTAYTNADIHNGGSGCVMWFGDLIDIRQWEGAGQDLYIRMANSELGHSRRKKRKVMIISVTLVMVILALLFSGCCYISRKKKGWRTLKTRELNDKGESNNNDVELPLFDLGTISAATNNFSRANKLGEGGFGPVYKGKLEEGQDIAVKRLSKHSLQGMDEFKNEVILISKLQHRNLVKILGCCIEGDERMLIYEYMPNRSLDFFVFDMARSKLLDWHKRFNIILGIARGILYLHHDSRLRIIHRDLKASNILLDSDMEPKISDFGMARIFGGDEIEANTNRVVGTHGYMSPEYAVDGQFSIKSDVFSFGVLVLEILNGKRNRGFYHHDHQLNLLGHAWRLWTENKAIELVDQLMGSSFVTKEVVRCIHIALLCVQQSTQTRPTMSSVILMLSSDDIVLPQPEPPGFYVERSFPNSTASFSDKDSFTFNDVSVTMVEGR